MMLAPAIEGAVRNSATWIMRHEGGEQEKEWGPGGYNYTPSKMFHEGWVGPDGNLLLITVDGPWDLNLMEASVQLRVPSSVISFRNRPVNAMPAA